MDLYDFEGLIKCHIIITSEGLLEFDYYGCRCTYWVQEDGTVYRDGKRQIVPAFDVYVLLDQLIETHNLYLGFDTVLVDVLPALRFAP